MKVKRSPRIRSEDYRRDKVGVVLVEMGLINVLHFGTGLQGGVFLDDDTIIAADLFSARFDFLGKSQVTTETVRLHRFVSNSFYLVGGAGLRQSVTEAYSWRKSDQSTFRANHFVGEFALGNRWQMKQFTIGCDWFGLTGQLVKISSSESHDDDVSVNTRDSRKHDFDSQNENVNIQLVRFHLGFVF